MFQWIALLPKSSTMVHTMKKFRLNLTNRKGQFFIAAAIIAITTISAIIFFISQAEQVDTSTFIVSDDSFFLNNIAEEYQTVADLALSNASRSASVSSDYFTATLNNLTDLVQNVSNQKGISVDTNFTIITATNETMNATINITLISEGDITRLNFNAASSINISIVDASIDTGPACTFDFSVHKEYAEPILFLNNTTSFTAKINGTSCGTGVYVHEGNGIYNATCVGQACVSSEIAMVVTDFRNVVGTNNTNS